MNDDLPRDAHPPRWIVVAVQVGLVLAVVWSTVRDCSAADEWTPGEKLGEAAYLALHTVDWAQTRWIAEHQPLWRESFNTALGEHPSPDRVDAWFIATTIAQPLIANALPQRWRDTWIAAGVMMEFTLTTHNASIGIRMNLP